MKKWKQFLQNTGHYWLAVLCVGAILLSALWTRDEQRLLAQETPAHADGAQRLQSVTPTPAPVWFTAPAAGAVLRSFSEEPVFFAEYCCYALHPSTDLVAEKGEKVYAAFDGQIHWEGEDLYLIKAPFSLRYRGVGQGTAKEGQAVKKGAVIGKAAGNVPYEGEHIVCLTLYREEKPVDIALYLPE